MRSLVVPLLATSLVLAPGPSRRVVITFDDLPVTELEGASATETLAINRALIEAFREHAVPAVGFVNEESLETEGRPDPARVASLEAWVESGLELGNHTRSHVDLHRVSRERFQDDVLRGETITRPLVASRGGALRWFRHPYLHTGTDLETKRAVEAFLAERGYRVAPVTLGTGEWVFGLAYTRAGRRGDGAMRARLVEEYLAYLERKIDYFERQSVALFGREIPQISIFHVSRLNGDVFGRVALLFERRGYRFATLESALSDPAYGTEDLFVEPRAASWLHRWAFSTCRRASILPDEPEVAPWVLREAGVSSE
jgi:peptidoglycan/xylan/chitin deacetylase (PgdA/CDA1 family)